MAAFKQNPQSAPDKSKATASPTQDTVPPAHTPPPPARKNLPSKQDTPPPKLLPPERDTAQWRAALAAANGIPTALRPSDAELTTLMRACTEPQQLHLLLEAFARHATTLQPDAPQDQHPYPLLCDFVDDSAHDLSEWVSALAVFDNWLREHQRHPQPLNMLLPYLACSAQSQASLPLQLPLPHVVADMLEAYGYDGKEP